VLAGPAVKGLVRPQETGPALRYLLVHQPDSNALHTGPHTHLSPPSGNHLESDGPSAPGRQSSSTTLLQIPLNVFELTRPVPGLQRVKPPCRRLRIRPGAAGTPRRDAGLAAAACPSGSGSSLQAPSRTGWPSSGCLSWYTLRGSRSQAHPISRYRPLFTPSSEDRVPALLQPSLCRPDDTQSAHPRTRIARCVARPRLCR